MDAGIADAINRRDAVLLSARLDAIDDHLRRSALLPGDIKPWYRTSLADTLISDAPNTRPDRAWLLASLIAPIPTAHFDGEPADGDWDNLFGHLRAEIESRRNARDSKIPPAPAAETGLGCVV